jgi:hypothetical protein
VVPTIVLWTVLAQADMIVQGLALPQPADRIDQHYRIAATVGGKKARMLLSTTSPDSFVTDRFAEAVGLNSPKQESVLDLRIGASIFEGFRLTVVDNAPAGSGPTDFDGVLGRDFFLQAAVGFNLDADEVVVWPSRSFSREAAERWISRGTAWPAHGGAKLVAAAIKAVPGGFSTLLSDGTRGIPLTLGSQLSSAYLTSEAVEGFGSERWDAFDGALSVFPKATLGGLPTPFSAFSTKYLVNGGDRAPSPISRTSLSSWMSRYLVFDLAKETVLVERGDHNYPLSRVASSMVGLPLYIDGSSLLVGPIEPNSPKFSALKRLEHCRVLRVNSIPAEQIVRSLKTPRAEGYAPLRALVESSSGCQVEIFTGGAPATVFIGRGKS